MSRLRRELVATSARDLEDAKQLQRISGLLIDGEHGEWLHEQILDAAIAIMRSDFGSIQMLIPERGELHLLAWRNFHPESAAFWQNVSIETGASCGAALKHGERIIVPDAGAEGAPVTGEVLRHYRLSGIASVQSTPLTARDGRVLGMISTHWRDVHTPGERELRLLDVLARQAADFFERRRAQEALLGSLRERESLLRELHHRVKNNLQVITSLFEMEARQSEHSTSLSFLMEARNRVTAIASIHELLYQSGSFSQVNLTSYARRLLSHVVSLYGMSDTIAASVVGDAVTLDLARAVPAGLLLNELVSNRKTGTSLFRWPTTASDFQQT